MIHVVETGLNVKERERDGHSTQTLSFGFDFTKLPFFVTDVYSQSFSIKYTNPYFIVQVPFVFENDLNE